MNVMKNWPICCDDEMNYINYDMGIQGKSRATFRCSKCKKKVKIKEICNNCQNLGSSPAAPFSVVLYCIADGGKGKLTDGIDPGTVCMYLDRFKLIVEVK